MAAVTFDHALNFTRSSEGTYIGADGLIKTAAVDEPRFTHDPVTGEALGLLIEEQRTNLWLWSSDLTKTSIGSGSSVTLTTLKAPDGSESVYKLENINTDGTRVNQEFEVEPGETYTLTFYALAGNITVVRGYFYDRINATTLPSGPITELQEGSFTKIQATVTIPAGCTNMYAYVMRAGELGDYFYATSPQFEKGSYPTSYIRTEGAQVTRAADECSRTLGAEYSSMGGTLSVTAAVPAGETVVDLGSQSIVSDSDAEKTYALSYTADPNATTLDVAPGASVATVKKITYDPRA